MLLRTLLLSLMMLGHSAAYAGSWHNLNSQKVRGGGGIKAIQLDSYGNLDMLVQGKDVPVVWQFNNSSRTWIPFGGTPFIPKATQLFTDSCGNVFLPYFSLAMARHGVDSGSWVDTNVPKGVGLKSGALADTFGHLYFNFYLNIDGLWRYSCINNSWSHIKLPYELLVSSLMSEVVDELGHIYVSTIKNSGYTTDIWVYYPFADDQDKKGDGVWKNSRFPQTRFIYSELATDRMGHLYVTTIDTQSAKLWRYTLVKDEWQLLKNDIFTYNGHNGSSFRSDGNTIVNGYGQVYVTAFIGVSENYKDFSNHYAIGKYDPQTNTWEKIPTNFPKGYIPTRSFVDKQDQLYVLLNYKELWAYDKLSKTWHKEMPAIQGATINRKVYQNKAGNIYAHITSNSGEDVWKYETQ